MTAWGGYIENFMENFQTIFENGFENSKMISKITSKIRKWPQTFENGLNRSKMASKSRNWSQKFENELKNYLLFDAEIFVLPLQLRLRHYVAIHVHMRAIYIKTYLWSHLIHFTSLKLAVLMMMMIKFLLKTSIRASFGWVTKWKMYSLNTMRWKSGSGVIDPKIYFSAETKKVKESSFHWNWSTSPCIEYQNSSSRLLLLSSLSGK